LQLYTNKQGLGNQAVVSQQAVFNQLIQRQRKLPLVKTTVLIRLKHLLILPQVPVRDYEDLKPYVDKVVAGQENILWKGKPLYFAKTSGTTSGQTIPLTKESMPYHIQAARNAILLYIKGRKC
jgi:hypothetical protein